jgi:hypothetical protein
VHPPLGLKKLNVGGDGVQRQHQRKQNEFRTPILATMLAG